MRQSSTGLKEDPFLKAETIFLRLVHTCHAHLPLWKFVVEVIAP